MGKFKVKIHFADNNLRLLEEYPKQASKLLIQVARTQGINWINLKADPFTHFITKIIQRR